jgi:hypothetical protein
VLVFYQMLTVLKFFSNMKYFATGVWFFFVSTILQVFLAVFFIVYREDDPKLLMRIKVKKQIPD